MLAQFGSAADLLAAVEKARAQGYCKLEGVFAVSDSRIVRSAGIQAHEASVHDFPWRD
jgi:hypothetical protein